MCPRGNNWHQSHVPHREHSALGIPFLFFCIKMAIYCKIRIVYCIKVRAVSFMDVGNMPIEGMHPEPRDSAVGWPVPFCPALTSQRKPVLIYS